MSSGKLGFDRMAVLFLRMVFGLRQFFFCLTRKVSDAGRRSLDRLVSLILFL